MNTCSRRLDIFVYDGLYTDRLSRLVYHDLMAGLENLLTCCLVVVVEMAETCWIEMDLEEGHKETAYIHWNELGRMKEANTSAESCGSFNSYLCWM